MHVTNCFVWRTMCKSAARSISPCTSKTVLSILMMPMCLLTYPWKGELANRYYCREVELLMDYFQELHGLLPGDASGLLIQPYGFLLLHFYLMQVDFYYFMGVVDYYYFSCKQGGNLCFKRWTSLLRRRRDAP